MNIAIHNPHLGPNIYTLGIHNYILNLIRDGHTPYIFIDQVDKGYTKQIIKKFLYLLRLESFFSYAPANKEKMPWNLSNVIFSQKTLNSKCDVLISFNTYLGEKAFSSSVKNFNGLKIWHVGDYFWNEAASIINKRFIDNGISHIMGYASHDKHCDYFKSAFPSFEGRVIPVAFGYADRFKNINKFENRKNKSVGVGSVNPLRPLESPVYKFRDSADFYPDESWFHRTRREFILQKDFLSATNTMDLMFPEFPQIKDFKYDLVAKFNEYKMFSSCESIWYFPPAKTYEGSACGSVNICIDHDCNKEFGFVDGENCIMYEEGDVDSYIQKVKYYQDDQDKLNKISKNSQKHVYDNFRHEVVARNISKSIKNIYLGNEQVIPKISNHS